MSCTLDTERTKELAVKYIVDTLLLEDSNLGGEQLENVRTQDEFETEISKLYDKIKAEFSNKPAWEKGSNVVLNQEAYDSRVSYNLKSVSILSSDKAKQSFEKGEKNGWDLGKILTELQIPKDQKQIILDKGFKVLTDNDARIEGTTEQTLREEIITSLLAENSFIVEVNTATDKKNIYSEEAGTRYFIKEEVTHNFSTREDEGTGKWSVIDIGGTGDASDIINTSNSKEEAQAFISSLIETNIPSSYHSSLTVPGGTNYREDAIQTPDILNVSSAHTSEFSKGVANMLGWFRSDDQGQEKHVSQFTDFKKYLDRFRGDIAEVEHKKGDKSLYWNEYLEAKSIGDRTEVKTKTRRILEVQSDLFQKGRDKKNLVDTFIAKQSSLLSRISSTKRNKFNIENKHDLVNQYGYTLDDFISKYINAGYSLDGILNDIESEYPIVDGETMHFRFPDFQPEFYGDEPASKQTTKKEVLDALGLNIPSEIERQEKLLRSAELHQANLYENNLDLLRELEKELASYQSEFDKINKGFDDQNNFLQLLNKKGNWINFFIQSVIQDSVKKGYGKVLFPTGETAANVEGHQTVADEITKADDLIKTYKEQLLTVGSRIERSVYNKETKNEAERLGLKFETTTEDGETIYSNGINPGGRNKEAIEKAILSTESRRNNMKTQGLEKIKPIEAFYSNRVTNILNKLYDIKEITDEHGNTWNEIDLSSPKVLSEILLQKDEANKIIGQANITAGTVLIDSVNKKDDTVPHEYAHHYIAMYRDTDIVKEGIKKWGSEEKLVQAIGEAAVTKKGEAWTWWQKFSKMISSLFQNLDAQTKEKLADTLTKGFLQNYNLKTAEKNSKNNKSGKRNKGFSIREFMKTAYDDIVAVNGEENSPAIVALLAPILSKFQYHEGSTTGKMVFNIIKSDMANIKEATNKLRELKGKDLSNYVQNKRSRAKKNIERVKVRSVITVSKVESVKDRHLPKFNVNGTKSATVSIGKKGEFRDNVFATRKGREAVRAASVAVVNAIVSRKDFGTGFHLVLSTYEAVSDTIKNDLEDGNTFEDSDMVYVLMNDSGEHVLIGRNGEISNEGNSIVYQAISKTKSKSGVSARDVNRFERAREIYESRGNVWVKDYKNNTVFTKIRDNEVDRRYNNHEALVEKARAKPIKLKVNSASKGNIIFGDGYTESSLIDWESSDVDFNPIIVDDLSKIVTIEGKSPRPGSMLSLSIEGVEDVRIMPSNLKKEKVEEVVSILFDELNKSDGTPLTAKEAVELASSYMQTNHNFNFWHTVNDNKINISINGSTVDIANLSDEQIKEIKATIVEMASDRSVYNNGSTDSTSDDFVTQEYELSAFDTVNYLEEITGMSISEIKALNKSTSKFKVKDIINIPKLTESSNNKRTGLFNISYNALDSKNKVKSFTINDKGDVVIKELSYIDHLKNNVQVKYATDGNNRVVFQNGYVQYDELDAEMSNVKSKTPEQEAKDKAKKDKSRESKAKKDKAKKDSISTFTDAKRNNIKSEEALEWFNNSPLSKFISIEDMHDIANSDGYAEFVDSVIKLYEGSEDSDIYHEAFHAFTQRFMSPEQVVLMYDEVKNTKEFAEYKEKYSKKYPNLSNEALNRLSAEELLADKFKEFMLTGKTVKFTEAKIAKGFFARIKAILSEVFKSLSGNKIKNRSLVNEVFSVLKDGTFNSESFNRENGTLKNQKLYAYKESPGKITRLTSAEKLDMLNSMESIVADLAHGNSNSDTDRASNYGLINAVLVDQDSDIQKRLFPYIKNRIESSLFELKDELEEEDLSNAEVRELERSIVVLNDVLENFGDTTSGYFNYLLDSSKIFEGSKESEDFDIVKESEKLESGKSFDKDSFDSNSKNLASKFIKSVMNIIRVRENGNVVYNKYGFAKLMSQTEVYTKIRNATVDSFDVDDIKEAIEGIEGGWSDQIISLLGDLNHKSSEESNNWTAMLNAFNLSDRRLMQTNVHEESFYNGEGYEATHHVTSGMNQKRTRVVTNDFKKNFKTVKRHKHIKKGPLGNVLIIRSIIKKYSSKKLKSIEEKYEFLKDIGMPITKTDATDKILRTTGVRFLYLAIERASVHNLNIQSGKNSSPAIAITDIVDFFSSDQLMLENKEGATVLVRNQLTVVKEIASAEAENSGNYASVPTLTADNEVKFEEGQMSSLGVMQKELNNATDFDSMVAKPSMSHLSYENNPSTIHNRMLKELFEFDENTRRFGNKIEGARIEVNNVSGTQFIVDRTSSNPLYNTTSATADVYTRAIQDVYSSLLNGKFSTMTHADKSTVESIYITNSADSKNKAKSLDIAAGDFQSTHRDGKSSNGSRKFAIIALGYLQAELDRINIIKESIEERAEAKKNGKEYTGDVIHVPGYTVKDKNDNISGDKFTIFKDIFSKELGDKIIEDGIEEHNDEAIAAIIKYLERISRETSNTLDGMLFMDAGLLKKIRSEAGSDISVARAKELAITTYTANYFIHNLNSISLIYGDLAQFNHANEDFHKRNASLASTGKTFRNDRYINNFLNNPKNKTLSESLGYDRLISNGDIETAILDEVISMTFESYEKDFRDHITERLIPGFTKVKSENLARVVSDGDGTGTYSVHLDTEGIVDEYLSLEQANKSANEFNKASNGGNAFEKELEKHSEEIEAYVEKMMKTYNEMEEADGQGWITIDSYRQFAIKSDTWSDKHEELYNAMVNGETIKPEDITEYFSPRKYQYSGPLKGKNGKSGVSASAFHKYSLAPLVPQAIKGTNLEKLNNKLMKQGFHYATMSSGSKISSVTAEGSTSNDMSYSGDVNNRVTEFEKDSYEFTPNVLRVEYFKEQLSVNTHDKGKTILSTQMRVIIEEGLYDSGVPVDFMPKSKSNKRYLEWNKLKEVDRVKSSPIHEKAVEYERSINKYIQYQTAVIYESVGVNDAGLTEEQKTQKIKNFIREQLSSRDLAEHELEYMLGLEGESIPDLSYSLGSDMVERALNSIIYKKIIRHKVNGEPYVQMSSTFMELSNPTDKQRAEHQKGLRSYRLSEDGKTVLQAEIKIPLNGHYKELLNLKGLDGKRVGTIERLNELILNEEWLSSEDNRNAITLVGVRIPVQGLNSMENMIVVEFLDPALGNVLIPPKEIVAKSGADFDVDKLSMMSPSFTVINGKVRGINAKNKAVITNKVKSLDKLKEKTEAEIERSTKGLKDSFEDKTAVEEKLDKIKDLKKEVYIATSKLAKASSVEHAILSQRIEALNNEMHEVHVSFGDLEESTGNGSRHAGIKILRFLGEFDVSNYDNTAADKWLAENSTSELVKKALKIIGKDKLKAKLKEKFSEIGTQVANGPHEKYKFILDALSNNEMVQFIHDGINNGQPFSSVSYNESTDSILDNFVKHYNTVVNGSETLREINKDIRKAKSTVKNFEENMLETKMILDLKGMMELRESYIGLITPNSTDLFTHGGKATQMEGDRKYNPKRNYNSAPTKKGVSPTRILEPAYNMFKHAAVAVGGEVLGIAAVVNKGSILNKRLGLVLNSVYSNSSDSKIKAKMLLKHNSIGGRMNMGGVYDANGSQKISDVISQMMNGYLDVAKDSWIFDINAGKTLGPTLMFMIEAGVPVYEAIDFLSNDAILRYADLISKGTSSFAPAVEGVKSSRSIGEVTKRVSMELIDEMKIKGLIVLSKKLVPRISWEAVDNKTIDFANRLDIKSHTTGKHHKHQKEFNDFSLLHFLELNNLQSTVQKIRSAFAYDTTKLSSFQEAVVMKNKLNELIKSDIISSETIKTYLREGPIKGFRGVDSNGVTVQEQVWGSLFNDKTNRQLSEGAINYLDGLEYREKSKTLKRFGDEETVQRNYINDAINYSFSNKLSEDIRTRKEINGYQIINSDKFGVEQITIKGDVVYVGSKAGSLVFSEKLYSSGVRLNLSEAQYKAFAVERAILSDKFKYESMGKDDYLNARVESAIGYEKALEEGKLDEFRRGEYDSMINEDVLFRIFSLDHMFSGGHTLMHELFEVLDYKKAYFANTPMASAFTTSTFKDKQSRKEYSNIALIDTKMDPNGLTDIHNQLKSIIDTSIKFRSKYRTNRVDSFFKNLPLYSVAQSGFSASGALSTVRVMPKGIILETLKGKKPLSSDELLTFKYRFYYRAVSPGMVATRYKNYMWDQEIRTEVMDDVKDNSLPLDEKIEFAKENKVRLAEIAKEKDLDVKTILETLTIAELQNLIEC